MAKQHSCLAARQSRAAKSFFAFRHHIVIIIGSQMFREGPMDSGRIELDVHGMTQVQAQIAIDAKLRRAKGVYRITVIHGYSRGTSLRDFIRSHYRRHPASCALKPASTPARRIWCCGSTENEKDAEHSAAFVTHLDYHIATSSKCQVSGRVRSNICSIFVGLHKKRLCFSGSIPSCNLYQYLLYYNQKGKSRSTNFPSPDRISERSNTGSALQVQNIRRTTATVPIPHMGYMKKRKVCAEG